MKTFLSIIFSIWIIYKIIQVIGDPSKRKIAGLIILIIFAIGLFIYFSQVKSEWDFEQEWKQEQNMENECKDEAIAKSNIYIYLDKYPNGYYRADIMDSLYKTDDELWNLILELKTKDTLVISQNTNVKYCNIDLYEYYLGKYPEGNFSKKAKKSIIDLRVDRIAESVTGVVPPSVEEMFGNLTETVEVHIRNVSNWSIDILYSGKIESKEIHMSAFNRERNDTTIFLPRGKYRMTISGSYGPVKNYFEIKDYSYRSYYTEMWRMEWGSR